jgi:hypothetical protein
MFFIKTNRAATPTGEYYYDEEEEEEVATKTRKK